MQDSRTRLSVHGVGMSTFRSFFERMVHFFSWATLKPVRFVSFLKWENSKKKKSNLSFFILSNSNFLFNFCFCFYLIFQKVKKSNFSLWYWIIKKFICFIYLLFGGKAEKNVSFCYSFIKKIYFCLLEVIYNLQFLGQMRYQYFFVLWDCR